MKFWQIKAWIVAHPLYSVLLLIALLLLLFSVSGSLGSVLDRWHASKFDKKEQQYEKQIQDLKTERDKAIKEADEAAAKATIKEAEAKELRDLIDQKGGAIAISAAALEKKLEETKNSASNCQSLSDSAAQLACLCERLRANGFECH